MPGPVGRGLNDLGEGVCVHQGGLHTLWLSIDEAGAVEGHLLDYDSTSSRSERAVRDAFRLESAGAMPEIARIRWHSPGPSLLR